MNVLFVQPVFGPTPLLIEKNISSLNSLSSYVKQYPYPMSFAYGGYATDWKDIERAIYNPLLLSRLDRNYGKGYTVNKIIREALPLGNFKHILTADSDIIFDTNCPNLVERLVYMAEKVRQPFGIIALNQKGASVHNTAVFENKTEYKHPLGFDESVYSPNEPRGLGGGCIFTSVECWQAVGGYRVMGVYAGDDGWYLRDTASKGYSWHLSESISIFHPPENDIGYARWKLHKSHRCNGEEDFEIDVRKTEEYWKSR